MSFTGISKGVTKVNVVQGCFVVHNITQDVHLALVPKVSVGWVAS